MSEKFKIRVVMNPGGERDFGVSVADHFGADAVEEDGTLVVEINGKMVARYSLGKIESWAMVPGDVD